MYNSMAYNDRLDANAQVSIEEWVAAKIFEIRGDDILLKDFEEMAQRMGKEIVLEVLTRFRGDLIELHLAEAPDIELTADELREKYDALAETGHWGEHPRHTASDWRIEAGVGNTRLGYWDWVEHQLENIDGAEMAEQIGEIR